MDSRKTLTAILAGAAIFLSSANAEGRDRDEDKEIIGNSVEHKLEEMADFYYSRIWKFRSAMQRIERVNRYDGYFKRFAKRYSAEYGIDVPVALVKAIAFVETGGRQYLDGRVIESGEGALGIMQLMPRTAWRMGVNPRKARSNIKGGIRYLAHLLKETEGDVARAVNLYNCHPQTVKDAEERAGSDDFFVYGTTFRDRRKENYVLHVLAVLPFFGARYDYETGQVEKLYKSYVAENGA